MTVLRIVPHRTALNNNTRQLQTALHEVLSIRSVLFPWQHHGGLYVIVRSRPRLWWITRLHAEEEGGETVRHIEFFAALPRDFVDVFKMKVANHPGWSKTIIKEVNPEQFALPDFEHTDIYRVSLKRHAIFSLGYDYAQQTTPIREFMAISDELRAGESVDVFICAEPMNRIKWKRIADYAWSVWNKGGVPYKPGVDIRMIGRSLATIIGSAVNMIYSLIQDTFMAIERAFFHGEPKDYDKNLFEVKDAEREELLVNGDLSHRTKRKRNLPVYKTAIRCLVHSPDDVRRHMLARSVAAAFDSLTEDNRLEPVKITIRAKKELDDLRSWRTRDIHPSLLSVDEIGKLMQLPTADLQQEYKSAMKANRRVEVAIPKAFIEETGILAGTASIRGETQNIYIPTVDDDMLFVARAVVGSPRMGKDQHVINLVVEAKRKHGIGAVIPDVIDERNGHRGMADAIRDHLPPEDVLDFDLSDFDHPIQIGLHSIVQHIDNARIAADRIAEEVSEFLLGDEDEERYQTMLYLREAAKIAGGDLLGIKLMFTSQQYRDRMRKEKSELFDFELWDQFERLSEKQQNQIYVPIMKRLGQLEGEVLKPMFFQAPNPKMDLYRWIDEGKVVIFRIPSSKMSERAVQTLTYWIVLNVFLIKLAQGGKTKARGTFLVLNEPHQYLSPGFVRFTERMLTEGPKYRIAPVLIFHHPQQFRKYPGFIDVLMSSSINWHLFRNTNSSIYEKLMPYLSLTFESPQKAFEATKRFQYIACWLNPNGEYEPPFVVDALPLVSKRYKTQQNGHLTIECTRKYGRRIDEVLDEIKQRSRLAYV